MPRGKRKGPGRPALEFTADQRKMVEAMAAYGIPQRDIARVIGCALETLRKNFENELALGSTKATARVAEFLFQKATGQKGDDKGAVTAAIFWMKARAGWRDQRVVLENPDGTGLLDEKLKNVPTKTLEEMHELWTVAEAAAGEGRPN